MQRAVSPPLGIGHAQLGLSAAPPFSEASDRERSRSPVVFKEHRPERWPWRRSPFRRCDGLSEINEILEQWRAPPAPLPFWRMPKGKGRIAAGPDIHHWILALVG